MVIPLPTVTGSLHMGHAFNTELINPVVRFQRLRGKTVWPASGTDQASIAVRTIHVKRRQAEGPSKDRLRRDGWRCA